MSTKERFYRRLPELSNAMLDTLTDVLEQEELAEYQTVMQNAPIVVRVFVEFDVVATEWHEV